MITVSRVANASKGQLLCITYELLLEKIQLAKQKDGQAREAEAKKAVSIIQMLAGDLDFEFQLAKDLFRIYVYVQGLLIQNKYDEKLEEAYKLIEKLYVGFKEAAEKEDVKNVSIQNAEVIYAGMTYGRESLNEMSLERNYRGFEA